MYIFVTHYPQNFCNPSQNLVGKNREWGKKQEERVDERLFGGSLAA